MTLDETQVSDALNAAQTALMDAAGVYEGIFEHGDPEWSSLNVAMDKITAVLDRERNPTKMPEGFSLTQLSHEALKKSLKEFDRLGRDEFLKTYGYRKGRGTYMIKVGRKLYDSKPIIGVAFKWTELGRALRADEFSGGAAHLGNVLRKCCGIELYDTSANPGYSMIAVTDQVAQEIAEARRGGTTRSMPSEAARRLMR
jgi:hypothetical protein